MLFTFQNNREARLGLTHLRTLIFLKFTAVSAVLSVLSGFLMPILLNLRDLGLN